MLSIADLSSTVAHPTQPEGDPVAILQGVNLSVRAGEVHVLMGQNGSGKSTLAHVLMGHPGHTVTAGAVTFLGENLLEMETDERARVGLFLAFQYPFAVPGLASASFLKDATEAVRGTKIPVREFRTELREAMTAIGIDKSFMGRSLNEGFSGGEKKRLEILQLSLLKPKLAILDETDSGLDVDAMRRVFEFVDSTRAPDSSLLIITHYNRILDYVTPTHVHVMQGGRIVRSGGRELSAAIEKDGFEGLLAGEDGE